MTGTMVLVEAEYQPSSRQLTILVMCARGHSRDEIGRELFIAPRTVKQDLDFLREGLDARNVTHAVGICVSRGLICPSRGQLWKTADVVEDDTAALTAAA